MPAIDLDFNFRIAKRQDTAMLLCLYAAQIGRKGCTWNQFYPDADTIQYDIEHELLYVLTHHGNIIGAVTLGNIGDDEGMPVIENMKRPCELARLCVCPTYAGHGVGKLLMQYAEQALVNSGFDYIRLLVAKCNPPAIHLYEACGFKQVGEAFAYDIDFYQYVKLL